MFQTSTMTEPFFSITIGNVISAGGTVLGVYIAYLKLASERKKEQENLTEMHAENRMKLDSLITSRDRQEEINRKRDAQVHELALQTSQIAEMAKGFNRRLEMLEDRRSKPRE